MARIAYRIWPVVWEVIAAPFGHFGALLRFGIGPLLFAMMLWPPSYSLRIDGQAILSLTDGVLTIWDPLRFLAALPFAAAFAAAWNRLMATGEEGMMGSFTTPFDRKTWSVAWAFVRLLAILVGVIIVVLIPWVLIYGRYADREFSLDIQVQGLATIPLALGTLASGVFITWFMLRFALTIPAAAIGGDGRSLRQSWSMTRPIQFRMLFATLLLLFAYSVVVFLFIFAIAMAGSVVGSRTAFYAGVPVLFLILMFGHALWAGLLGSSYRAVQRDADAAEVAAFD